MHSSSTRYRRDNLNACGLAYICIEGPGVASRWTTQCSSVLRQVWYSLATLEGWQAWSARAGIGPRPLIRDASDQHIPRLLYHTPCKYAISLIMGGNKSERNSFAHSMKGVDSRHSRKDRLGDVMTRTLARRWVAKWKVQKRHTLHFPFYFIIVGYRR